ncbi:MAG: outer membrane lipoprotein carrier protein LolA [Fodinibius sp.]|nr:outer membrane lipoprotein carrier protein LolA [Fodinibius sp.]
MIWTNTIDNFIYTMVLALLFCGLALPSVAQQTPFAELKQKFEQGAIFNADFRHQSVDSYTQDTSASSGRIWVGERKYKVRAKNQLVVVDGQTSMVYDDNRNRVILSKYVPEEDDFAPSRILNGVDSTFTVEQQKEQGSQIYIRLSSDDPFAIYKKVEIYLSKALVPQKIRAVDPVDNVITTSFSNGQFIESKDSMFSLKYPDSAEIVDMRN